MEVEAKFSVPDRAVFDQLCRLDELVGYRLQPTGVQKVYDRYLDTDERSILLAGYACRLRRKGQTKTLIATLKGLGGADAGSGIHQRTEHEVSVDGPDLTTWPESRARELAVRLSAGRPLRELFSLRQERHQRLLYEDAPGGGRQVAELSLDVVTPGGSGPRTYFELEIELLDQGRDSDLFALAEELRTNWGLRPEPRSKFQRGLALSEGVA